MDIMDVMKSCENIYSELEKIRQGMGNGMMLSALCMAFDFCAAKSEQTSAELLEHLSPLILAVNSELGAMETA